MRFPAYRSVLFLSAVLFTWSGPSLADSALVSRIADWALGRVGRQVLVEFAEGQLLSRYFGLSGERGPIERALAKIPEPRLRALDTQITLLGEELSRGARLQPSVSKHLFTRETKAGIEFVPSQGWGEATYARQHYTAVLSAMNASAIEALEPAKASTGFLRSRLLPLTRYFVPDGWRTWEESALELLRERLVLIQVDGDPVIRIAIDDFLFTFREFDALLADELLLAAASGVRKLPISYLTHPRLWMPAPSGWAASRSAFLKGDLRAVPKSVYEIMGEDQGTTRFRDWVWEREAL